jgi:hypothetical protein
LTRGKAGAPDRCVGRTQVITHDERQIVFMDFSRLTDPEEALAAIEEARQFIAAQPRRRNLLTLVDVADATTEERVVEALKALAGHNKPWVLASAVIGIGLSKRLLFKLVALFSGRKFASFASAEDAKAWLVRQWVPPSYVPGSA